VSTKRYLEMFPYKLTTDTAVNCNTCVV